jgi:AhpD family alkylhydroperoxidase
MNNPAMVVPKAMQALQAVGALTQNSGLKEGLLELVYLRASQINGCSVCVDGHPRLAKKAGETDERLFAVAAWRDSPYFTDAERAAFALTEAVTRLSDRTDPVPGRDLERGCEALRRADAGDAADRDRQYQRLEPAQRRDQAARGRVEALRQSRVPDAVRHSSCRSAEPGPRF